MIFQSCQLVLKVKAQQRTQVCKLYNRSDEQNNVIIDK